MIKTIKRGRATWTLCHISSVNSVINYLNWSQSVTGIFRNIAVKPYHGRIWNPNKVVWIVEG